MQRVSKSASQRADALPKNRWALPEGKAHLPRWIYRHIAQLLYCTFTVTAVVLVRVPEVPVTVTV
jgi:hypothetical protein